MHRRRKMNEVQWNEWWNCESVIKVHMISSLLFVVHMHGQFRMPTYTGPAHKQSGDFGKMQQFPNYFQTHPDISQIFSRYLIILFSFKKTSRYIRPCAHIWAFGTVVQQYVLEWLLCNELYQDSVMQQIASWSCRMLWPPCEAMWGCQIPVAFKAVDLEQKLHLYVLKESC